MAYSVKFQGSVANQESHFGEGTSNTVLNIPEKLIQYERFVNNNLKQDLEKVHMQRVKLYSTMANYLQLGETIGKMKEFDGGKMKTQVDLGCNAYCQAEVMDTKMIFVAVGYGFFVEFTFDEALGFIDKKVDHLTKQVESLTKNSAKIKANIRLALQAVGELQELNYTGKK